MPDPSLILDTCTLHDKAFLNWLKGYNGVLQIPSVVYMERCRQILRRGNAAEDLDTLLRNLHIKVVDLNRKNARIAAELMAGRERYCEGCSKIDWADTIVASYFNMGDYIVTDNRKDFPTSEEIDRKVITTAEIMNRP